MPSCTDIIGGRKVLEQNKIKILYMGVTVFFQEQVMYFIGETVCKNKRSTISSILYVKYCF